MRNQACPKPECMYLHDLGDQEASFTKEEMHQGKHQEYERKLVQSLHAHVSSVQRYNILAQNDMVSWNYLHTFHLIPISVF